MERFDLFITENDEIKYEKTYYFNKSTKEIVKVKHDNVTLNAGDKTMLKMLSSIDK